MSIRSSIVHLALAVSLAVNAAAQVESADPTTLASAAARPLPYSTFESLLERRAKREIQDWAASAPLQVGTRTKTLLGLMCASERSTAIAETERMHANAAFLAECLSDATLAAWIRAVLAWSPTDRVRYQSVRTLLAELPAKIAAGQGDEAWTELSGARPPHLPEGAWPLFTSLLSRSANAYFRAGSRERAREIASEIADVASAHSQGEILAWYRNWLGNLDWMESDLAGARSEFETALAVSRAIFDWEATGERLCDLASVKFSMGDLEGGLRDGQEAETIARARDDRALLRRGLHAQASALAELGQLEEALDICSALELEARGNAEQDEIQVRVDMVHGGILSDVGRLESALAYIERARSLADTPPLRASAPLLRTDPLLAAGLLYGDLRQFDRALATLDEARAFLVSVDDRRGQAWADKNRGFVLYSMGRFEDAMHAFERAAAYAESEPQPFLSGWCALGRAESASRLPVVPAEIDAWIESAEQAAQALGSWHLRWRIEALRGSRAQARGDQTAALEHFRAAVLAIERLRRKISVPGLLSTYLRDKANPYRDAAFAAAKLGHVDEAWRFAELLRGRVLFEMRSTESGPLMRRRDDPDVVAERRAVTQLESLMSSTDDTESHRALEDALRDAEAELDRALLRAEVQAPRATRLAGATTGELDLASVARRAAESGFDSVIEYVIGEHETLILWLTPERRDLQSERRGVEIIAIGENELAILIRAIRDPIEAVRKGELDLANLGFDVAAARELHARLWKPVAEITGERVAIVPDGPLWSLPFDALVSGGAPSPVDLAHPFAHLATLRFVAQDHALAYLPCAALLTTPQAPSSAQGVLAILAPRSTGLEAAEEEALGILELESTLFGPVRVVRDASTSDVVERAPSARWLHFAAHGIVDPVHPAQSHLVLGSRTKEAERMSAWDIEDLELESELVVLSACHSGEGSYVAGEGVLGLTRSFLGAGAREVVASLWAVEDRASAEFMRAMYGELARGATPIAALRAARLALMRTTDARGFSRAHPYFWAAWVSHRGG